MRLIPRKRLGRIGNYSLAIFGDTWDKRVIGTEGLAGRT